MVRSIDKFLIKKEQDIILNFMEASKRAVINGRTLEKTAQPDIKPLKEIYCKKLTVWDSFLDTLTKDQRTTYRNLWKGNRSKCAIEEFLATLKNIIDGQTPIYLHLKILDDFTERINICNQANLLYSCPAS